MIGGSAIGMDPIAGGWYEALTGTGFFAYDMYYLTLLAAGDIV